MYSYTYLCSLADRSLPSTAPARELVRAHSGSRMVQALPASCPRRWCLGKRWLAARGHGATARQAGSASVSAYSKDDAPRLSGSPGHRHSGKARWRRTTRRWRRIRVGVAARTDGRGYGGTRTLALIPYYVLGKLQCVTLTAHTPYSIY